MKPNSSYLQPPTNGNFLPSGKAYKISVKGLVQGVGFRPHIYRIALKNKIEGWVKNSTIGVQIKAIGEKENLENFIRDITNLAPPVADISAINVASASTERRTRI
jgi:hydrogenase maturation protein HypF